MNRQQPASPRTTFVCGLLAVAMGLFLLLVGLGVVPMEPRAGDGPLWIATAAGIAFMLAGISVAVGAIHGVSETGELPKDTGWWMRLFYYVIGRGDRRLRSPASARGSPSVRARAPSAAPACSCCRAEASDMVGRIVFGLGAVLTWLVTIAIAVSGARKLFSGSDDQAAWQSSDGRHRLGIVGVANFAWTMPRGSGT